MKKLLLVTLLAGVAGMAQAAQVENNNGGFVQLDLVKSKITFKGDSEVIKKSPTGVRLSTGLDLNNNRFGFEGAYLGSMQEGNLKLTMLNVGFSYARAFPVEAYSITPYVGARVGASVFNASVSGCGDCGETRGAFSYGAFAGAEYNFTKHLALGAAVEYNAFGKIDEFTAKGVTLNGNVRFKF